MAKKKTVNSEQFVVRAARGLQRSDGGIVWRGMLWLGDQPIAAFFNAGDGGCVTWRVYANSDEAFGKFKALAAERFPELRYEQEDHLVGELWDAAFQKAAA